MDKINELIELFSKNREEYCSPSYQYNETQARTDFISPLIELLGWDVYNKEKKSIELRDVFEEATVEVGEERQSKKPDYEIRAGGRRKFFIEAKKPSVDILKSKSAAFQARRYGFSAGLSISVLTNFRDLVIYDCRHLPKEEDEPHVARIAHYSIENYSEKFPEISSLLSKSSVLSGEFDKKFSLEETHTGTSSFDKHFLNQVRSWRIRLAESILAKNPSISDGEINYIVQIFISRIIFLRICEDRDIEKYSTLKQLSGDNSYQSFLETIQKADSFYDSGLFDLVVEGKLNIIIDDSVLNSILDELYYPQSPYTFAVVEASVLGEIYEIFLGEHIEIVSGAINIIIKPEVRESGGVVPTPQHIVKKMINSSLGEHLKGKSPGEVSKFTVADICCGSGIFLLGAFECLCNHYLNWHIENNNKEKFINDGSGTPRLAFSEKREILIRHIRGVDIDADAVEIAKLSLFLKLIENETLESLIQYHKESKEKILPQLDKIIMFGNSLIDTDMIDQTTDGTSDFLGEFDWEEEFEDDFKNGGFDFIVGNPPYIRIQKMVSYSPQEVAIFQHKDSPYRSSKSGLFDKYFLFVERSLELINEHGKLSLIIPHKFMSTKNGSALREVLTARSQLKEITHFGAQQVFGQDASNYTCIIYLDKEGVNKTQINKIPSLNDWIYLDKTDSTLKDTTDFTGAPWSFDTHEISEIFTKVKNYGYQKLSDIADIFVGVQTSKDPIYIFEPTSETDDCYELATSSGTWKIEKSITRPCLHDVPLEAFSKPAANKRIIFPYNISNNKAHLIQPDILSSSYPGCYEYLLHHKNELEDRNITGGKLSERQWYQYGRSQSLTKFTGNKIILPILSKAPKYSYDDSNIVVTGGGNGPYYLIRAKNGSNQNLNFILAALCHPLSEALVRSKTSVFRGGYYSHGKQFIEDIPIPEASDSLKNEVSSIASELVLLNDKIYRSTLPKEIAILERQAKQKHKKINAILNGLFGITSDECTLLLNMPIPE